PRLDLLNRQRFIAQSEQRANPAPVTADAVAVLGRRVGDCPEVRYESPELSNDSSKGVSYW
ncbi:hypothetical protein ACFRCW_27385, partial [Streptomyces sp. NPDC056653]|uniref:hypothetical protein n=1 Tax=Streptomyces sp. NPDC056653 TaxID=3345894 RepID=UPI0036CB4B14